MPMAPPETRRRGARRIAEYSFEPFQIPEMKAILQILLPLRWQDPGEGAQRHHDVDPGPAQVRDRAAGRGVVRLGEELAAQHHALVAGRADLADQVVPVGDLGPRSAAQGGLAGDGEDGPQRLPAPAGVDHALGGQSFPGQVQRALDGGGAGLVRADVKQAGTRLEQDRSHGSPGLFAAPRAGF